MLKQLQYDYSSYESLFEFMIWYSKQSVSANEKMNMFYPCVYNHNTNNFLLESWCNVGYAFIEFSTTKFIDYPENFQMKLEL